MRLGAIFKNCRQYIFVFMIFLWILFGLLLTKYINNKEGLSCDENYLGMEKARRKKLRNIDRQYPGYYYCDTTFAGKFDLCNMDEISSITRNVNRCKRRAARAEAERNRLNKQNAIESKRRLERYRNRMVMAERDCAAKQRAREAELRRRKAKEAERKRRARKSNRRKSSGRSRSRSRSKPKSRSRSRRRKKRRRR